MLRFKSDTIVCAGAGEYSCLPLSGAGPGKKKIIEVWIYAATATDTIVDDFRIYIDTELVADIPKEMIWGKNQTPTETSRRIVIPLGDTIEVNEHLKVAILSDAGTHNYETTVVYEM